MIGIIKNIIEVEIINARNLTSLSDCAVKMEEINHYLNEKLELELIVKLNSIEINEELNIIKINIIIKNYKNLI